jgi:hypothetical protein
VCLPSRYLFWSQVLETISTFETANVLSPWSIFIPELLELALWSEAGMFPVLWVELPVPLAEGELVEADGLVLALPLEDVPVPGALSLIAPPLPLEAVVELLVLLPAGAVVVVVVVVVGADPLLAVLDPPMLELLLALGAPLCQSPCSFTEWPTCADRSCVLEMLAILPFFSCSI